MIVEGPTPTTHMPASETTTTTSTAPPAEDLFEQRTREIGRDLFARIRRRAATQPEGFLDQLMMRLGMFDEQLKAQLFRFVDVLPVLTDPARINRHLREYMNAVDWRF